MRFDLVPHGSTIIVKDNEAQYSFLKYGTKMLCTKSFMMYYCRWSDLTEEENTKRNCRKYGSNYFGSSNLRKVLNGEGNSEMAKLIKDLSKYCEKQIFEVDNSKGFIRKHGKKERFLTFGTIPDEKLCEDLKLYGCPFNGKCNDEYSIPCYKYAWTSSINSKFKSIELRYYKFLVEPKSDTEIKCIRSRFETGVSSYFELEL